MKKDALPAEGKKKGSSAANNTGRQEIDRRGGLRKKRGRQTQFYRSGFLRKGVCTKKGRFGVQQGYGTETGECLQKGKAISFRHVAKTIVGRWGES